VLIGYMDVQHGPWQSDDAVLTVHGRYDPRELPALLARYRVRLVAYRQRGPRRSASRCRGVGGRLSVVVPPFGALAERLDVTGAGWAWTDDEWRDEAKMLARIAAAVAPGHAAELAAASNARGGSPATLDAMAERTLRTTTPPSPRAPGAQRLPPFEWARACGRGKGTPRACSVNATSESADWIRAGAHTSGKDVRRRDAVLPPREPRRSRRARSALVLGEVLWQLGRLPDAVGHGARPRGSTRRISRRGRRSPRRCSRWATRWARARRRGACCRSLPAMHAPSWFSASSGCRPGAGGRSVAAAAIASALGRSGARVGADARGLSRSLSTARRRRARSDLLAWFARAPHLLAQAPLLLAALAVEHAAADPAEDAPAVRAGLAAMLCDRPVGPPISTRAPDRVARRFDAAAGPISRALCRRVRLVVRAGRAARWPQRLAGAHAPRRPGSGKDLGSTAVDAIARLPRDVRDHLAVLGAPNRRCRRTPAVSCCPRRRMRPRRGRSTRRTPTCSSTWPPWRLRRDHCSRSGRRGRSGRCDTARAARSPLVDRAFDDADSLVAALVALHEARDRSAIVRSMRRIGRLWSAAVRAHQQRSGRGTRGLRACSRYGRLRPAHYLWRRAARGRCRGARPAFAAALAARRATPRRASRRRTPRRQPATPTPRSRCAPTGSPVACRRGSFARSGARTSRAATAGGGRSLRAR
jgi:hypothetical protein